MRRVLTAAAVIFAASSAQAAQVIAIWNGGTGSWSSAGSWSGGVVPSNNTPAGTTYDVRIDGGKPVGSIVNLAGSTTVDLLTVDSGDRVNTGIHSYVIGNGGSTTVNGLFSIDNGGQFLWNSLGGTMNGSGQYLLGGGRLSPNSAGATAKLTMNSTLLGRGELGLSLGASSGMVFDNNGFIGNETAAGTLFIRSRNAAGVESRNFGTIRASGNGGVIDITHGTIRQFPGFGNYTGHIEANGGGSGATLWIRSGVKIIGGNVDCYQGPGAVVNIEGGAVIERDPAQGDFLGNARSFVSFGTMNIFGGATLNGASYFVNFNGTIDFKAGATNFNNGNMTLDSGLAKVAPGVLFDAVTITTGTSNPGGGTVRVLNGASPGAAVFKNVTVNAGASGGGVVEIGSTSGVGVVDVQGTLTNNGRIVLFTPTGSTAPSRITFTQDSTFAGTGRLVLDSPAPAFYPRITATNGSQILTNAAGHTITGAGSIGDLAPAEQLQLINAGTIEASNGTLRMYLNGSAHTNTGVIRSKSNLLLGNLANYTFNNSGQIVSEGVGRTLFVGGNFGGPGTRGMFTGNGQWIADGGELTVFGDVLFNTASTVIARNGGMFQYAGTDLAATQIQVDGASVANFNTVSTLNAGVTNHGTFIGRPLTTPGMSNGPKLSINGAVRGNGTFIGNLLLNGSTNPGEADGTRGLLTTEVATLSASHTLVIDIAAADHDRLVIGGEGVVAGTLQLNRNVNFVPMYGASRRVLASGFASGQFSTITGVQIDPLHAFAVTYDAGGVNVVVALPGDATLDRRVNFDDLLILAQGYGRAIGQTWITGDFTGDSSTGFDDLLVLAQRYGNVALVDDGLLAQLGNEMLAADWKLALSIVPEPGFVLPVLAGLLLRRHRRH